MRFWNGPSRMGLPRVYPRFVFCPGHCRPRPFRQPQVSNLGGLGSGWVSGWDSDFSGTVGLGNWRGSLLQAQPERRNTWGRSPDISTHDKISSWLRKESAVAVVRCTKYQRICEGPLLLPRRRKPHGKTLRRLHAMNGFVGFWTRRNRRQGAAGSSSRARNFSVECAGRVVGLGARIVEANGNEFDS